MFGTPAPALASSFPGRTASARPPWCWWTLRGRPCRTAASPARPTAPSRPPSGTRARPTRAALTRPSPATAGLSRSSSSGTPSAATTASRRSSPSTWRATATSWPPPRSHSPASTRRAGRRSPTSPRRRATWASGLTRSSASRATPKALLIVHGGTHIGFADVGAALEDGFVCGLFPDPMALAAQIAVLLEALGGAADHVASAGCPSAYCSGDTAHIDGRRQQQIGKEAALAFFEDVLHGDAAARHYLDTLAVRNPDLTLSLAR